MTLYAPYSIIYIVGMEVNVHPGDMDIILHTCNLKKENR